MTSQPMTAVERVLTEAAEWVRHNTDCAGVGMADEHCDCGAVAYLNRVKETINGLQANPQAGLSMPQVSALRVAALTPASEEVERQQMVDWLRNMRDDKLCHDAANEIERLTAELATLRAQAGEKEPCLSGSHPWELKL